jgi:hypothetical protein
MQVILALSYNFKINFMDIHLDTCIESSFAIISCISAGLWLSILLVIFHYKRIDWLIKGVNNDG